MFFSERNPENAQKKGFILEIGIELKHFISFAERHFSDFWSWEETIKYLQNFQEFSIKFGDL